jgi:hypothetical protein
MVSVRRSAISEEIGECDAREMDVVADGLRRWLELA